MGSSAKSLEPRSNERDPRKTYALVGLAVALLLVAIIIALAVGFGLVFEHAYHLD